MSYADLCRVDRLEESVDLVLENEGMGEDDNGGADDDDDEFDEYEEEFGNNKGKKPKKKAKAGPRRKGGSATNAKAAIPKRFKPTTLSFSILSDPPTAVKAVPHPFSSSSFSSSSSSSSSSASAAVLAPLNPSSYYLLSLPPRSSLPPRHFCPVSGLPSQYRDPRSGLRYYDAEALQTLAEKAPFWINPAGGNCSYAEAVKMGRETLGMPL